MKNKIGTDVWNSWSEAAMCAAAIAYDHGWASHDGCARNRINPYARGTLEYAAFEAGRDDRRDATDIEERPRVLPSMDPAPEVPVLPPMSPCRFCESRLLVPYWRGLNDDGTTLDVYSKPAHYWELAALYHEPGCPWVASRGMILPPYEDDANPFEDDDAVVPEGEK